MSNYNLSDIFEYENILIGKKSNFKKSKMSKQEKEKKVANIWKYAISDILEWEPLEAVKFLDESIVKMICLDKTYPIIGYVPTQTYKSDFRMFLSMAFPEQIKFDIREQTLSEYKHVAKLEQWFNDDGFYRYPKNFFRGKEGLIRARLCFQYALSLYMSHMTIEEMYEFFSDEKRASVWLKRFKLDAPYRIIFDSNALDYFHYSLQENKKNNLLFYNHMIEKNIKKKLEE